MSGRVDLERWFDEEVSAFRTACSGGAEPFKHLCQALGWAYALDEFFKDSDASYEGKRDADTDGAILRGLRFARNRVFHQALQPIRHQGTGFPFPLSSPFGSWFTWKPASQLTAGRPDPRGKQIYETRMQNKDVNPTLDATRAWFLKVP
ncbi:MAG: hypothetical protein E6J91_18720 [Deltaproteobacteria bacterium]|nr:MAG: hypothetical protein E6J91_18720 [Deltaproteobacteria bacterium]